MKKLMTIALLTLSLSTAFAQSALPTTLAATMKAMVSQLKPLAAQINNPAQNASSAQLADQFVVFAQHAKDFTPDSVSALPADQQADAIAQYQQQIDSVVSLGQQLAAALRNNDNATAVSILNQLAQAKKTGHDQFNP